MKPRKPYAQATPLMPAEALSIKKRALRNARITLAMENIIKWVSTQSGIPTFAQIKRAFPSQSYDTIKSAVRILKQKRMFGGKVRERKAVRERRKKLIELLEKSRVKLKPNEIIEKLKEDYAGFKDPRGMLQNDFEVIDERLREKVIHESSRARNVERVRKLISKNPALKNIELAELIRVSKRELEYILSLVPESVRAKRVIKGASAETRSTQNSMILAGIDNDMRFRNILANVRRITGRYIGKNGLYKAIERLTGYGFAQIRRQNAIILEELQKGSDRKAIETRLRQAGIMLKKEALAARIKGLSGVVQRR